MKRFLAALLLMTCAPPTPVVIRATLIHVGPRANYSLTVTSTDSAGVKTVSTPFNDVELSFVGFQSGNFVTYDNDSVAYVLSRKQEDVLTRLQEALPPRIDGGVGLLISIVKNEDAGTEMVTGTWINKPFGSQ